MQSEKSTREYQITATSGPADGKTFVAGNKSEARASVALLAKLGCNVVIKRASTKIITANELASKPRETKPVAPVKAPAKK